jgi:hypothetical protein
MKFITKSALAEALMESGDTTLLEKDVLGRYHFNGTFTNANSLEKALDQLKETGFEDLVEKEYDDYLNIFEQMFDHRSFTGRSGTFYGYEGLGSIYWHMVSKLLLAVQENIYSRNDDKNRKITGKLIDYYYEIRAGIGINKSPEVYGAFSTDPYSHTPGNKGAQQPGMTGQVKEDILNRWAELGIIITEGKITFIPFLFNKNELLQEDKVFNYYNVWGKKIKMIIRKGELAFTFCQVPVVYRRGERSAIHIDFVDGTAIQLDGTALTEELSSDIFMRNGKIECIRVSFHFK